MKTTKVKETCNLATQGTDIKQLPFFKASTLGTSLLSVWCWEEIAANSMLPIFKIPAKILYTECTSWKGQQELCLVTANPTNKPLALLAVHLSPTPPLSWAPLQLGSGTQFPTKEQVGWCGWIQSLALQKQTCLLHAFFPIIAGWTSQQPSLPHSCLGFLRPMTAWNKVVLQHEPLTLKCFHKGPLIFFVL